jgi:hypothetical protein
VSATPATVPAAEAPISPVSAVVGTFSRPSETFRRLVARPTWWLPLVLIIASTAAAWLVVSPKMDMDRTIRESIEKRAEKSGRTIPPEAMNRQVELSRKLMPMFFGVALAGSAVLLFFPALVFWGSAKAMGADARYKQLLSIWGHASLPNVLGTLLGIPIFLQLPDGSLTQEGVGEVVKSNVGAFLDPSAPAPLRAFAGSLDVFSLSALFLLVLGFRRLPGLSKGAATATPVVLWLVYVIGKVAWRAVMG